MEARRAAACLILLVAGCSLQPVYERPDAPVAGAYPTGPAYKPVSPGTPAADLGWREFLKEPRLQRLVEIALANNRDLRVAALNIAQYEAQYRITRSAGLPQVGLEARSTAQRAPSALSRGGGNVTSHEYSAGLTASWTLDFFGRLRSLNDQALQQYLGTAQAGKAAYITLVSGVVDQYLGMLAADELLAVTQRTLEAAQKSYELAQAQFEAGIGNELSLRQAQTVVEQATANHAAQVRARAQAENALVLLLGQPLPADLLPGLAFASQQFLADIPEGLPSELLTRRPDIMQAEANLRATYANIGAARAAFFPDISLTATLGSASLALSGLFGPGSLAWSFIPSLVQPIFEGGRLKASLDLAKVQKESSVAQYEKSVQSAFREVADALAARGTYDEQIAALGRYTDAYARTLELSELRFKTGVDSYLNVLTAQTNLYSAQQALVSTRLARLTNLVDLYRILGGGWIEHTGDAPRPAQDLRSTQRSVS
jgi:outer membrane protein, multidrug efflux system